jgi:hypothetical protein
MVKGPRSDDSGGSPNIAPRTRGVTPDSRYPLGPPGVAVWAIRTWPTSAEPVANLVVRGARPAPVGLGISSRTWTWLGLRHRRQGNGSRVPTPEGDEPPAEKAIDLEVTPNACMS